MKEGFVLHSTIDGNQPTIILNSKIKTICPSAVLRDLPVCSKSTSVFAPDRPANTANPQQTVTCGVPHSSIPGTLFLSALRLRNSKKQQSLLLSSEPRAVHRGLKTCFTPLCYVIEQPKEAE